MVKFGFYISLIFLFIDLLILLLTMLERFYWIFKKIESDLITIAIKKSNFVIKNKIKVHKMFTESICVIENLTNRTNKKLFYKFLIFAIYFSLVFWISFNINEFSTSFFQIFHLVFYSFFTITWMSILFSIIYRIFRIKKMVKIKNKISSDDKAKLFYLNLNNKKDTDLFHTGSIKNLKASGILINKLEQNTEIIISYNSIGYKNVFNINKQKIMLNRDILLYKLNGNKEKARIIHYLLVVYSNYEKEEFYNANYNENINYFLYLEKYYKK